MSFDLRHLTKPVTDDEVELQGGGLKCLEDCKL